MQPPLIIKDLGRQDYQTVWQAMQSFTDTRTADYADEIWLVEHNPVFTQGQAGKPEHLINSHQIPVVQSDRGGQITYHGPGQQIAYILLNLRRNQLSVRELVSHLENAVIQTLAQLGIEAYAKPDAPGVYINQKKICSLGLRIRRGCSFHGLALNVDMDLTPFQFINPCGYAGMEMTQVCDFTPKTTMTDVQTILINQLIRLLNISNFKWKTINE